MQETGNNNTAATKRLIMRIAKDSLHFACPAEEAGGAMRHVSYKTKNGVSPAANLREAIREGVVDFSQWQRVLVLVDSPVAMMPIDEYREEDKEKFYRYTVTGQENNAILATRISRLNAVAVYSISKDLRLVLTDNFSDIKINPVCTYVWQFMHKHGQEGNREKLFGYFHDGALELFSFRKNRFRFTNRFPAPNAEDTTYYILATWQQTGLNRERDELNLLFNGYDAAELMPALQRYISNVTDIASLPEYKALGIPTAGGAPFDMIAVNLK